MQTPKILTALIIFCFPFIVSAQVAAKDLNLSDSVNRTDASGRRTGYWIEKQGDVTFKGEYQNNLKIKNWVGYYPNKVVSNIEYYSNGVKDGISMQCDRKGKITLVESYKNGQLHGESVSFGQNNDNPTSETNYANGRKSGLSRKYSDNGKIQEETVYKNDLKNGQSRWYNKSGKLIAEYHYKNGKFDGVQKTFYENDTLQSSNNYLEDQLSGESKEYYRNGKLKISGKYLLGQKDGVWTEYDELGKPQKVTKYKNGQETGKK